jgi:hypothetical protein
MTQMIEPLPSMCMALDSIPSTARRKKKKRKENFLAHYHVCMPLARLLLISVRVLE